MITVAQVKATLAAVAAEQSDHMDARVDRKLAPRYVEHGQPCCLAAVILHRLGFTIAQLRQLDTEPGTSGGGVILDQSRHPLLRRVAPEARALLAYVQKRQDSGRETWAEIADRALQRGRYAPDQQRQCGYAFDRAARSWTSDRFPWNKLASADTP